MQRERDIDKERETEIERKAQRDSGREVVRYHATKEKDKGERELMRKKISDNFFYILFFL